MPTIYTHYKMGYDVLDKLNINIKKDINNNSIYYTIFNQGFDNVYYYLPKLFYYKKFGVKAHKQNLDIFFNNLITTIKDNNYNDYTIIYGFINHIVLDTLIHPYINYMVKFLNIPHTKIEFMLDTYLFKINNEDKWHGTFYKTLIPRMKFPNNLNNILNEVFLNTYNENNMAKIFNKSHNTSYYLYRYLIYDKHLIKSKIYKIIDLFSNYKLSRLTFSFKDFDERVLNKNNLKWHSVNNINETYTYSFIDLYNICIKIAIKLNTITYNILNDKEGINTLLTLINKLNLSNIELLLS